MRASVVAAVRRCRARRSPGAAGRSRTRPGAPASRSSSTSRPGSSRTAVARGGQRRAASRRAARGRAPRRCAGRRRASPLSSELGLVDSISVTQRSTTSSSSRSPWPRWTIADWVRLPTILWVLETTRSAPERERVPRQLVVEGEVRAPRLVHDQRHAVGVRHLGQRRPRRPPRRSRWARPPWPRPRPGCRRAPARAPPGVMQWAMCSSGSSSGATNVGRRPDSTSASIVLEWALRWTTTSRPRWASVSSATWLPCDAPLTRNHARRAPHASAARRWASSNGVGSGPTSMP